MSDSQLMQNGGLADLTGLLLKLRIIGADGPAAGWPVSSLWLVLADAITNWISK
jgi:hypothetical protein